MAGQHPHPPRPGSAAGDTRPASGGSRIVLGLECIVCGKRYAVGEVEYVCPDHGPVGTLDVLYDYDLARRALPPGRRPESMWAYRALLPVAAGAVVPPLAVGGTPLYAAPRLARAAGVAEVWVKDEGVEPTGSLKDRASSLAVVKAAEAGAGTVTTASTGNAAAALAGVCASVGMRNVIFVPETAPEAKVAQLLAFGSVVVLVEGSYDDAVDLSMVAADRFGWYNRDTGFNPYMTEGKKTVMLEIFDQLGGRLPDAVVVGGGEGCIIGSLHKAGRDLAALGLIRSHPRLIGVQAEGSSYLADAWAAGEDVLTKPPAPASTVADSIAAALPRDRIKAMRAVTATGGAFVKVADDDILAAIPALARGVGVFAEPAAAASYAGLVAARRTGVLDGSERVVILSTGSGLKDVRAVRRAVDRSGPDPIRVPVDADAMTAALSVRLTRVRS